MQGSREQRVKVAKNVKGAGRKDPPPNRASPLTTSKKFMSSFIWLKVLVIVIPKKMVWHDFSKWMGTMILALVTLNISNTYPEINVLFAELLGSAH